jgi:hypothetical protein
MLKEGKSMKMIVKLAVLYAALLFLTGVAFAASPCDCYEVTATPLDGPNIEPSEPFYVKICFDNGDNEGTISGLCSVCDENNDSLIMFFNSMSEQALTYHSFVNSNCVAYIKFHGDNQYVLTGLRFIDVDGRTTIRGHKTETIYCDELCD